MPVQVQNGLQGDSQSEAALRGLLQSGLEDKGEDSGDLGQHSRYLQSQKFVCLGEKLEAFLSRQKVVSFPNVQLQI